MKVELKNIQGKPAGKIELNEAVFDGKVNQQLLYQAVNVYIARQKSVKKASTKTRGEVRGSGAKPWRQKGTGRARVGEKRNPLWIKGGIVFGPKPRKIKLCLPKKVKKAALKSALNAKFLDKEIVFLDSLKESFSSSKTKDFSAMVKNLGLKGTSLFVESSIPRNLLLSSRNIKSVNVISTADLNVYDALRFKNLVLTKDSLSSLEKRLKS